MQYKIEKDCWGNKTIIETGISREKGEAFISYLSRKPENRYIVFRLVPDLDLSRI